MRNGLIALRPTKHQKERTLTLYSLCPKSGKSRTFSKYVKLRIYQVVKVKRIQLDLLFEKK